MLDKIKDAAAWILAGVLVISLTLLAVAALGYFFGLGVSVITPIQLTTLNSLKLGLGLVALHLTIAHSDNR